MSQTASQFYLPPQPKGQDPALASTLRSIEDHIQSTRTFYSGTILPGAKIAGSETNPATGIDLTGGGMQSPNFVSGSAGWRMADSGNVEFFNGTFRGNVQQTAVSCHAERGADSLNNPAGSYSLLLPTVKHNLGGQITVGLNYLSPSRTGIYLVMGYANLTLDVSGMAAGAYLRHGPTVGTGGTFLAANILSNQAMGGSGLGITTPVRLTAGTKVWLLITTNAQFDLLSESYVALHYLSEG